MLFDIQDKGSWTVMAMCCIFSLLLGSILYNLVILMCYEGKQREELFLSSSVPLGACVPAYVRAYVRVPFGRSTRRQTEVRGPNHGCIHIHHVIFSANHYYMILAGAATIIGNYITCAMVLDHMLVTMNRQLSNLDLWHRAATLLLARGNLAAFEENIGTHLCLEVEELEKQFSRTALRNFRRIFNMFDSQRSGRIPIDDAVVMIQAMLKEGEEDSRRMASYAFDDVGWF